MNLDFGGQVVLITGGAGGIGRAAAEGFLASGARRVVLLDAVPVALESAVGALDQSYPGSVGGEVADVADVAATREVVGGVLAAEGQVDVLFNVAGVNRRKPALDVSLEDWDYILGVNLRGLFFVTQAVGRHMVARGHGAVVNAASVSSVRGHRNLAPYAASKGGVAQLTRVLANEWAPHGVRVNAVAPGYLETGLTRDYLSDPAVRSTIVSKIPLGHIGAPQDVVGAVLFLASSLAAYVTGEILLVDGGRTVD
jgi:NAD(P)-dependent dehydrogenase (short-subunit alcohol dehydrogenase family)